MLLVNYGLGRGIGFTSTFLLVIVLRNCLVFIFHGRLLINLFLKELLKIM